MCVCVVSCVREREREREKQEAVGKLVLWLTHNLVLSFHNFARGANYLAARWFNSACGANHPYQALKGGLFCICVESTKY